MSTMLITGATSGIGEALALHSAEQGYRVIACGRNQDKLQQLSAIKGIQTLCFDVSDKQQTSKALANVQADIYVLNAGVCEYLDCNNIDIALFERVFSANFFGVINCLSGIRRALKNGNKVVIVDSLARLLPFSKAQAYGASKAAVHYLTKSLAVDLAPQGIKVLSVSPGFIETPLTDKNDFSMPMKMSSNIAAKALLSGIEKNRRAIYFPFMFSLIMRGLGKLPASIQNWICQKLSVK